MSGGRDAVARLAPTGLARDFGGVLRIRPFRRLWLVLGLSSFGDWLGLLATTALAQQLAAEQGASFAEQQYAIGGVLIFRFLPALFLGPFAGALADHYDRRHTMVVCDILRFAIFAAIPLTDSLAYVLAASFMLEMVSLFWMPAKEASVPNLVPKDRLEAANQLSLITTYGTAPIAAAVFSLLAVLNRALEEASSFFSANPTDLALWFNAGSFLASAVTIYTIREITTARVRDSSAPHGESMATLLRAIPEGWRFIGQTPVVRGLAVGILGAFVGAGAVIALGRGFTTMQGVGNAGYGVLFGGLFTGLAAGMAVGPRLLADVSRRRLFGLCILGGGVSLLVLSVVPEFTLAVVVIVSLGFWSGVAWVTGYTLLGSEVADDMRGRTFSFIVTIVRVDLLLVLAVAPFIAGAIGTRDVSLAGTSVEVDGISVTLFLAGVVSVLLGVVAFRQMDDSSLPIWREVLGAVRGRPVQRDGAAAGLFVAFEGGEGAGKSTQVQRLADWLRGQGFEVVVTREPGATATGRHIRRLLLDPATHVSARAEALLYAADRADHVDTVIRPALRRGAVVVTDRYVDSTVAYQGAGRELPEEEVERLCRWSTAGLLPALTVLLDVDPTVGLRRVADPPDRLEAEPLAFHERVRRGFQDQAARDPDRYLVLDATESPEVVAQAVRTRLDPVVARLTRRVPEESPA